MTPLFRLVFIGLALLLARPAAAQKYRTAAGVRFGGGSYGLTVQQLFLPKATVEALVLASSREWSVTGLAEKHFGILGPSLNYYLGAGAHFGNHKDDGAFGGFDGIIGAEYKLPISRFILSVDFKPSLEFGSDDWARFPTAFSVRYIIVKQEKKGIWKIFQKD